MTAGTATIVTMLTPAGRGAVAVVAVEGKQAAELVQRFFRPKAGASFADRPVGQLVYGRWGSDPGEDVVACRRSAACVEVDCHGGAAAVRRILDELVSAGAVEQCWTDFVVRRETSPIRAAARIALAKAATARTAEILLDQYHGALERAVSQIVANLDADKENLSVAASATEALIFRASLGLHLTQPWKVVVAGPPNVGKSSLVNALVGYQRAIVFDQPGTTRDVVTAVTAFSGWPLELCDTAGWRESDDPLETAGVARAREQAAMADCLLLVFDATQPWSEAEQQLAVSWPGALVVSNKCDLLLDRKAKSSTASSLWVSAVSGDGLDLLAQKIVQRLVPNEPQPGDAVPFTAGQLEQLQAALMALKASNAEVTKTNLLAMLASG